MVKLKTNKTLTKQKMTKVKNIRNEFQIPTKMRIIVLLGGRREKQRENKKDQLAVISQQYFDYTCHLL